MKFFRTQPNVGRLALPAWPLPRRLLTLLLRLLLATGLFALLRLLPLHLSTQLCLRLIE